MLDIAWSNPVLQGVIIGLAGVVVAAIAGFQGAKAGARIAADAARESAGIAQHEAKAHRDSVRESREADRADARLARFAERKLSLAVDLLLTADTHVRQAQAHVHAIGERFWLRAGIRSEAADAVQVPPIGPSEAVRTAFQAPDLVAPEVARVAGDLLRMSSENRTTVMA